MSKKNNKQSQQDVKSTNNEQNIINEEDIKTNEVADDETSTVNENDTIQEEAITEPDVNKVVEEDNNKVSATPESDSTPSDSIDNEKAILEVSEGSYIISLGYVRPEKMDLTFSRLSKISVKPCKTENSEIVVGPFSTKEEAINVRRQICVVGLKGKIKEVI